MGTRPYGYAILAQRTVSAKFLGQGASVSRKSGETSPPLKSGTCEHDQIGFLCFMTADERTLIANLFDRLKQAGGQAKDADADEFIRTRVSEQPASPYLLVQSTLVMQQALAAAQGKIAALEKKLADGSAPPRQEPGFLSGVANLFGVGPSSQQPAPPAPAPPPIPSRPASPSNYPPQPIPRTPSAGGGFLQTALSTAAGVAGGALLFQGIENLIGHNPGPFSGLSGPSGGVIGSQPPVENTEIVNNYFETNEPDAAAGQFAERDDGSTASQEENPLSDPGFDDPSRPDDGGDFAGGDDDSYV
jgi:uncharacterized protein